MAIIDTSKLYAQVAAESWQAVNHAWFDYQAELAESEDSIADTSEVYLFVFANGSWTIDHAQYIATTNGCISAVPIGPYNGPAELVEDIEANEDWEAIEDAERR